MRKAIIKFLLSLLLLIFSGCEKVIDPEMPELYGTWEFTAYCSYDRGIYTIPSLYCAPPIEDATSVEFSGTIVLRSGEYEMDLQWDYETYEHDSFVEEAYSMHEEGILDVVMDIDTSETHFDPLSEHYYGYDVVYNVWLRGDLEFYPDSGYAWTMWFRLEQSDKDQLSTSFPCMNLNGLDTTVQTCWERK